MTTTPPPACAGEASLMLAGVLDLKAAAALQGDLLARRGHDLALDASDVRRLGGQCLQILIAAVKAWGRDGRTLSFDNPSQAFIQALALFGLRPENLSPNSLSPASPSVGARKESLA